MYIDYSTRHSRIVALLGLLHLTRLRLGLKYSRRCKDEPIARALPRLFKPCGAKDRRSGGRVRTLEVAPFVRDGVAKRKPPLAVPC